MDQEKKRKLLDQMEDVAAELTEEDDLSLPEFQYVHRECIPLVGEESTFILHTDDDEFGVSHGIPAKKLHCSKHNKKSLPWAIR